MCENEESTVNIRVELEGNLANAFLFIKKRRGLKHNSEVVRQLVSEAAKREREEAT